MPPPGAFPEIPPVLVELGVDHKGAGGVCPADDPRTCDDRSGSTTTTTRMSPISAWDIINYLLATEKIQPDEVRQAHADLLVSLCAAEQGQVRQARATELAAAPAPEPEKEAGERSESSMVPSAANAEKEEEGEKSAEAPPPSLSRRQQKKLLREAAAKSQAGTSETCPSPSQPQPPQNNLERHVALRIYYDGEKYSGLAENVGRPEDNSIERALFAALVKAQLIASRETCRYSRCGRTDRGVSAAGQVVALHIKSAFKASMLLSSQGDDNNDRGSRPIQLDDLPTNSVDELRVVCPARDDRSNPSDPAPQRRERIVTEYSYDKILNNLLPPEIRVLGWCPVSPEFSARFSATSRTYRYFFVRRKTLNEQAMESALSMMVGTHDFRNFCRMDVEKVYNFQRTVYRAEVVTSDEVDPRVAWFEIHGQAFLWHQIRCIAAILFLVGEGLESPDVVKELLDVEKHPGKPSYQPANEVPLVLHGCDYDNLRIGHSAQNLWAVSTQQQDRYEHALVSAARIRNCLSSLHGAQVRVSDLVSFAEEKAGVRRKKRLKSSLSSSPPGMVEPLMETEANRVEPLRAQSPFGDAQYVSWKSALDWMWDALGLAPEASFSPKDSSYVPLLKRHMGPTYEEKVANLQQSARRKERYLANVIKKRKTKEEDAEFYRHMVRQGSSNV
jgi:tRNA pseudouridine38/39 synthase